MIQTTRLMTQAALTARSQRDKVRKEPKDTIPYSSSAHQKQKNNKKKKTQTSIAGPCLNSSNGPSAPCKHPPGHSQGQHVARSCMGLEGA